MRAVQIVARKARVAGWVAGQAAGTLVKHGPAAALRYVADVARGLARERAGSSRKTNPVDEQFGTDTAQNAKLHGMDIRGPNYLYGVFYRATDVPVLDEVLGRLAIRHEDYTFIDYGSGKGLVLLRASAHPFRKVVGVEFARELHETAQQNLARYPAELRRAPVELFHGDALEFEPPPGNLVLYFYEPFEAPMTRRMLARIAEFRGDREILVAYVWAKNPAVSCRPIWEAAAFLKKVAEGDCWTIYRT